MRHIRSAFASFRHPAVTHRSIVINCVQQAWQKQEMRRHFDVDVFLPCR